MSKKKIGRESLTPFTPLVAIDLELRYCRGKKAGDDLETVTGR
jgi:hypothetical protein